MYVNLLKSLLLKIYYYILVNLILEGKLKCFYGVL